MKSNFLIQDLLTTTHKINTKIECLKLLSDDQLTWRPDAQSWNILECLEHLCRYGAYYLPALDKAIHNSTTSAEEEFIPGTWGDRLAKSMHPDENAKKIKTFKSKNPLGSPLNRSVIDRFLKQQAHLDALLKLSQNKSLNKIRIPASVPLIRLKLGDAFRLVVYHIMRHTRQIEAIQFALTSRT